MPCHVPACPSTPGPSGFCRAHQNRLNAFLKELVGHPSITTADRIAIAGHPGWRDRPFGLYPVQTGDDTVRFAVFNVKAYRLMWAQPIVAHDRAAAALAYLDRKNGLTPAADVARLKAELDAANADLTAAYRDRNAYLEDCDELEAELDAANAALDRQASDIARLTGELADRERDITYACADRDEYMRERDEARAENGRLRDQLLALNTDLRLALYPASRPWWSRLWAWVTGGGS